MSTRDKYVKAPQEAEKSIPNELRVSGRGNIGAYVTKALELFDGGEQNKFETVLMRGIDSAIPILLAAAEIIRRRVPGLHQINIITSTDIKEVYEPLEEGLVQVVDIKKLSLLLVKLTLNPDGADKANPGYHAPLDASEIEQRQAKREYRGGRDNRDERPRGDRQNRGGRGGDRGDRGDRSDNRDDGEKRQSNRDDRDNRRGGSRNDDRDDRRGGEDRRDDRREDRRGGDREDRRGGDRDDRRGGDRDGGNRSNYRGNRGDGGNRDGGDRRRPDGDRKEGGDRRRDNQ